MCYYNMRLIIILLSTYCFVLACTAPGQPDYQATAVDTVTDDAGRATVIITPTDGTAEMNTINTGKITPQQLTGFARTAIGIPYKYASTDPKEGFDCSGFITYVFNHFGIAVPRTSVDFTHVKHEVSLQDSRPGDLILFTGTDSNIRTVGHMGIILSNPGDSIKFIHATSGSKYWVNMSPLNAGYAERFVKVIRIFPQNDKK